jgi:bacterioferritin (cytochrome b1)
MSEQHFEDVKENFEFDSELQYSSFCQMFQDWQYQQLMEEINKETK